MKSRKLLVLAYSGSTLHGTSHENSDTDLHGVYLPSAYELMTGKIEETLSTGKRRSNNDQKNSKSSVDVCLFSIQRFCQLLRKNDSIAMDLLFTPEEFIKKSSTVWETFQKFRLNFVTTQLVSVLRYAKNQADGHVNREARLEKMHMVAEHLKTLDPQSRISAACLDKIAGAQTESFWEFNDKKYNLDLKINQLQKSIAQRIRQYERRKESTTMNLKPVTTALKAASQAQQLLENGCLSFPVPNADFIYRVKTGQEDYVTSILPKLNQQLQELEELIAQHPVVDQLLETETDDFLAEAVIETYADLFSAGAKTFQEKDMTCKLAQ